MARLNAVLIPDRYVFLLADYDPKRKLADCTGPVRGYRVFCPFCNCRKDQQPTFSFTSEDDEDHWKCHNCRRSGDSYRLWARLSNWSVETDWRKIIPDVCGPPPLLNHSAFDGMTDSINEDA